jgi:hypothetical protein
VKICRGLKHQKLNTKHQKMTNLLIFSKNRPLQLECLLRSIHENAATLFSTIYVQYYSDAEYKHNYTDVFYQYIELFAQQHTKFVCVNEVGTSFFHAFNSIISYEPKKQWCLMVDDDILFAKPSYTAVQVIKLEIGKEHIFSLRLGDNITNKIHFDYKGSLDGNIYPSGTLPFLISEIQESENLPVNPNKWESTLTYQLKFHNNMLVYDAKPCLIGIPANKVSNTSGCADMGVDTQKLNQLYTDGQRIDYKNMNLSCNDVHKYVDYKFFKPLINSK